MQSLLSKERRLAGRVLQSPGWVVRVAWKFLVYVKEPRAESKRRGVEVSRGDPVSPERKLPRSSSARGKYRKRFATFPLGEGRMRSGAVKKIKAD